MKNGYGDMRNDEPTTTAGPRGLRHWLARQRGCVARDFWRARRASVALESAAVLSVLIVVGGGLVEIFSSVYMNETMNRAARAAARAVALTPSVHTDPAAVQALACEAMRRELGLPDDTECSDAWTVSVETGLTTDNLLNGESPDNRTGDMVRVHITWHRDPWSFNADPSQGDPSNGDSSNGDSSASDSSSGGSSGGGSSGGGSSGSVSSRSASTGPDPSGGGPPAADPTEGRPLAGPVQPIGGLTAMPVLTAPPGGPAETRPAEPEPDDTESSTLQTSIAVARSEPDQLSP